jgi:2-haloacid dehalogenase
MRKWNLGNVSGAQERLLSAIRAIPPYPDVVPALKALAAHFQLAIISNTEDALIEATVKGLEVPFQVITAELPDLQGLPPLVEKLARAR